MRKIFFLSSLLTFLFTSSIWAADISGTWVLKYTGHQGDERVLDMVVSADGENLTVSTTHPSLGEMAGTGTLEGDDVNMTLTATGERKIAFELKGTVTGDKMAGTREVKIPEGAQGGEQGAPQRGSQGDSSAGARSGAPSGAPGGAPDSAPGSDSSKAKETSNTWTAEKK